MRRQQIYRFILKYWVEHNRKPPSFREIAEAVDCTVGYGVRVPLQDLLRLGLVKRDSAPYASRSYAPIVLGWAVVDGRELPVTPMATQEPAL